MRKLKKKEMKKRGCEYCADLEKKRYYDRTNSICPHDECPYHELDKYKTYKDYLKSNENKNLINLLLKNIK